MAESVDATVSNTVGATHPGSSPGPGTELRILTARVLFSISHPSQLVGLLIDKLQHLIVRIGSICFSVKFDFPVKDRTNQLHFDLYRSVSDILI